MKSRVLLITILSLLAGLYLFICLLLYFRQESIIFYPATLPKDYIFQFDVPFEEHSIGTEDGTILHGLLFKADNARGLVFFLHGNAGALDGWGELAPIYTRLGYDVFMLDYRGFGKSEGNIQNQQQFYSDVQQAYAHCLNFYREQDIVVVGFSIGSAGASMLAARQNPRLLLLLAPCYSLTDMLRHSFPFVPSFLLKYKFENHRLLDQSKVPTYICHGKQDEVIPYASSVKLRQHLKPGDEYISLQGQDHNGIHANPRFLGILEKLLQADKPR